MSHGMFTLLCKASSLSDQEAADLIQVPVETIHLWHTGKELPPKEVIRLLLDTGQVITDMMAVAINYFTEEEERRGESMIVDLDVSESPQQALAAGLPPIAIQEAFVSRMLAWATTSGRKFDLWTISGDERGIYEVIMDREEAVAERHEIEEMFAVFEGHPGFQSVH